MVQLLKMRQFFIRLFGAGCNSDEFLGVSQICEIPHIFSKLFNNVMKTSNGSHCELHTLQAC